ncbi:MAG: hypothetical protein IPM32_08745 [Ignavibacteriae bacterium]|nr:hypothetical protein [Ignavibacteriota bacterium]
MHTNNLIVKISDEVFDRIYYTVSSSDVEEGGKLIGNISKINNHFEINVESYIDSGINDSKSKTHLYPDWNYQEKVFKTIELFDDKVNHIGSWHSHHCNGLGELSTGDIRSYFSDVNNPNYILDFFLAILVTNVTKNQLLIRYYLFIRGENTFFEIKQKYIRKTKVKNKVTELLKFFNTLTNSKLESNFQHNELLTRNIQPVDDLNTFRAEDNTWLKSNFSNVVCKRNIETQVISWEWRININENEILFKYYHPAYINTHKPQSYLKVFKNGHKDRKEIVPLNSERFQVIKNVYQEIVNEENECLLNFVEI